MKKVGAKLYLSIIFILLLALITSFSPLQIKVSAVTSLKLTGAGTINNPYLIEDFADLQNLSEYVYTGGNTSGKYFELTNDIDMKNQTFIPIGTIKSGTTYYFKGNFNGNGYTIKNLNIVNNSTYAQGDLGLFGYLEGTVENLSIDGGSVYLSNTDKSAGGIVGSTYKNAKVQYCYNFSTKVYTPTNNYSYTLGGIVGYSASADSTISCCYNQATIDNNGLGTVRAGGIVGYGQGTIDQCFNMGTITSGTTNTTTSFAGGITGENGTISNCYNKGKVTAQASSNVITDSKNYAKESVDDNDPLYSGLGYMNSGLTDNRYYSVYVEDYIDNSYNKGSICNAYAGGISGKNNSSLNCCLNLGDISGGYKETKYTVHYLIGATSMQASYYYADYYQTCIEEIVRYVNPISNGGSYTNCYSNKNLDSYDNDLYNCNYKIIAQSIKITPKDAIVNNDFDWMYAARNNKFTLFDCQAWSFHTPNRNNHPVVTKTKSYSNENSCNFQQDVDTYFYCTSLGGERVRDYGMRDCKISISNPDIKDYRYINIDFLYNRTDIVFEDKSAPRPETDFAKIELFNGGGNQSVPVPYDRNQNYDGNKLSVSLINNFAIKPTYPTILSSTTSLPPNFKTSIWAVSALINNNNPYLKCFFWQSNAATSFG